MAVFAAAAAAVYVYYKFRKPPQVVTTSPVLDLPPLPTSDPSVVDIENDQHMPDDPHNFLARDEPMLQEAL